MTPTGHLLVCMPALYRPEILSATLWSFERGLLRQFQKRTLILNLDPIGFQPGRVKEQQAEILSIAETYFDEVIYRFAEEPGFPRAVQWIWQQAVERGSLFFHLEDDWILNRWVPLRRAMELLARPEVASLRLHRQRNYRSAQSPVFSLNPGFFKTDFIVQALQSFRLDRDPEKQFSLEPMCTSLQAWRYLVMPATTDLPTDRLTADAGGWVSDLGVHWRKSQGLRKHFSSANSVWVESHENRFSRKKSEWLLNFKIRLYRARVLLNLREGD